MRGDIILATASPRRIELFGHFGLPFRSLSANLDETPREGETALAHCERLAREKAFAIAKDHPAAFVIGADTVVVLDDRILGKPANPAEADEMLHLLSGRTHEVMTGVALVCIQNRREESFVECTRVTFRHLSDQEIADYIVSGEPLDKAGAYGIQGGAGAFVEKVEGSYTNVVGLPMERLKEALDSFLQEP